MAKFIYVYHGGKKPDTEEGVQQVMQAWMQWMEHIGSAMVDDGAPVGMSSTLQSDGSVTGDGGSNPISGYSFVEADSIEQAASMAQGCPILADGGSVEIAQVMSM